VSEKIMRGLAATTSPPGIVGVAHSMVWDIDQFAQALANIPKQVDVQKLTHNLAALIPSSTSCLPVFTLLPVMIDIADPGNVGTIIRLADTFGADAVFFVGHSADSLNGKVIRASAGSLFHLPIIQERNTTKALDFVRNHSLQLLATTLDGELTLPQADSVLQQPTAWLFGNEAHGLAAEVVTQAQKTVRIPMPGQAESLNVATAAAICLYASSVAQQKAS
jgi:TrmH family RNA methyltransferase